MLASFPLPGVVVLLAIGVIQRTLTLAILFAAGLFAIDVLAWRMISRMFDREHLVTGATGAPALPDSGSGSPRARVRRPRSAAPGCSRPGGDGQHEHDDVSSAAVQGQAAGDGLSLQGVT
jgi:hypothetical protein